MKIGSVVTRGVERRLMVSNKFKGVIECGFKFVPRSPPPVITRARAFFILSQ